MTRLLILGGSDAGISAALRARGRFIGGGDRRGGCSLSGAFRFSSRGGWSAGWKGLAMHPRALILAILIAGVAPLFGFTAIALGLVGYVTTLFKLSAVLTVLWAWMFLGEGQLRERLLGASVMVLGGVLVAV